MGSILTLDLGMFFLFIARQRWLAVEDTPTIDRAGESKATYGVPLTLRAKLRNLPPLAEQGLWSAQVRAIKNLEKSLAENRPRSLIQMATGSGKTFTAINFIFFRIQSTC